MIKRLKRKYIFIVMCAVTAVLGVIITAINIASYSSLDSQLEDKLTMIVENEGKMPEFPPEEETPEEELPPEDEGTDGEGAEGEEDAPDKEKPSEEEEDVRHNMSPETPFETRYFTVKLHTDGTVLSVDTEKIAAVNDDEARGYANRMYLSDKEGGFIDSYKFMRGTTEDGNVIYVFMDVNRELESVRSFLLSSLIITGIGLVMIFVLVMLLSESALKPIIESYEKQKRFITDAGHEMKTPLTVIFANAEIIEMENGESQWLSGIKSQVSKLASLTEKLVILSKMEEGVKLVMDEFSLSEAFFDTSDQYKSIAMSKGITFDTDVPEGILTIGNEVEIRRCITLLLDNAFRYVNDGGTVSVKMRKLQSGVELRFSNSTNGVDKGSLDRWFDRFYRTDLSRNSDTGGSGIGLSVVKAIVNAHGGSVHASSEDGSTVEFVISI